VPAIRGDPAKKNQELLRKLEEKKYEDNHLKELERRRFQEAKLRLKNFVINRDMGGETAADEEQSLEQMRLLRYYKHRFCTFI
jgi:hypothetical protein